MIVAIPSRSRAHDVRTLRELRVGGYSGEVHLFVPRSQIKDYFHCDARLHGLDVDGISATRQAMINFAIEEGQTLAMFDDDLYFFDRPSLEKHDLVKTSGTTPIVKWLEDTLTEYAHCSVSTREQNFQQTKKLLKHSSFYLENERPYRIYAVDPRILREIDFRFDTPDWFTMDDFHLTLSLIRAGYPNVVSFAHAHNQTSSNAKGGASDYRDLTSHERSARLLYEMHPEFVSLVERTTIDSWGGSYQNPVTRLDVRIQWKKALAAG